MSCIWVPLTIGIAYFVLSAFVRIVSNHESKLDQVICYIGLSFFMVIMILGLRNKDQKIKKVKAEKTKWKAKCATTLMTILTRHEIHVWWDDSANRSLKSPNTIEIMCTDIKEEFPIRAPIQVTLTPSVFDRLKNKETVQIYYLPESTTTFLLEEEF